MNQVEKYNNKSTNYYGMFYTRFPYKGSFYKKEWYSNPIMVPFEDTILPVPKEYDKLLRSYLWRLFNATSTR